MHFSTWNVDASQILSRQELAAVLKDLKRRAARLPNVQMNLAIVRLACCCGLRASEIGGLTLCDVRVGITRPHLLVRAESRFGGTPGRWRISRTGSIPGMTRAPPATTRSSVRCKRPLWASRSTATFSGAGSTQPLGF